MVARKKDSIAPTRRSTRTASQFPPASASAESPDAKKRVLEGENESEGISAGEAKKLKRTLGLGDKLPDITLLDEDGNTVKVVDMTSEKGIILFAYPRASTPGCTKQACGFRDVFGKVVKNDYLIYGISTDSPKANKNFKEKQGLQYHLLSDQNSELLKALGATKEGNRTLRSSWVIGKGGVIEDVQLGTSPGDSVAKAMKKLGIEG